MKRLILFVSLLLLAVSVRAQQVQLNPVQPDKVVSIPFTGAWLPNVNPVHVGVKNYTDLKNLRYTDTGLETVEGYSKINTTALLYPPLNGFHFRKDNESHVLTKVENGWGDIYQNITAIPAQGNYEETPINNTLFGHFYLYEPTSSNPYSSSFSNGPAGTMLYADDANTLIWGGNEIYPLKVLLYDSTSIDVTDSVTNDLTSEVVSWDSSKTMYIGVPFKIDAIKLYISDPNTGASTTELAVIEGAGSGTARTITDGTSSGGVTLAQTGTIEITENHTPSVYYLNGVTLYWYYLTTTANGADIYKITVSAPLQPVTDVWNGSGRTCIGFHADRSGAYEDYTYRVSERSTEDAPWAATIGGLGATDYIYLMFDEQMMGFEITMLGSLVNAAAAEIDQIDYWNGDSFAALSLFRDFTQVGSASFAKTGVITWVPISLETEKPKQDFGKIGYVYRLNLSGTLTDGTGHDGTSVDYVTGLTAPKKTTSYDKAGFYAGRALLIKNNRIDYSLPDAPWIYNGVNTSDNGRYSLYFGDDTEITATASLFNRYGSNIIESLVVTKEGETYMLTGSQPYSDYEEPFIIRTISKNIGCPAPMTMKGVEVGFEVAQNAKRNAVIWLDATGPVMFDGATLTPLEGVENYFDPSESECIRYAYIHLATAYVDTIHNEYNLLFPSGSSATANNQWLVYDLKRRKWYKKTPAAYPVFSIPVKDAYGAPYNYGTLSNGYTLRLDHNQTWDGTQIEQQIMTGEFSPPMLDEAGLWSYSNLRGVKFLSDAISEDAYVTMSVYADGTLSSQSRAVDLSPGGSLPVSRNTFHDTSFDINAYMFKMHFWANTSTNKWNPLMWGYKSSFVRED